MSLRRRVLSATRWTMISFAVSVSAQFLQLVVLARILPVDDVGLIAIVTLVNGFAAIFLGMGLSQALIQRTRVTSFEVSSLFWLNLAISVVVTAATFLLSWPLAAFFRAPEAAPLLQLASVVFVIGGLSQMHRAIIEKRLDFRSAATNDVVGSLVLLTVTLALALGGCGAYSAVVGLIASTAAKTLMYMASARRLLRVRWRMRFAETRRFASFGVFQALDAVVTYLTSYASTVVVGRFVSVGAMGGYSISTNVAINLPARINPVFTRVLFPVFSKMQTDIPRMVANYPTVMSLTGVASIPLLTGVALSAHEFVEVFYGQRWVWIAPVMAVLCGVGMLRAVGNPIGFLLLATDRMKSSVIMNVIKATVTIPAVAIGAVQGGAMGAALALLGAQAVGYLVTYFFLRRALPIPVGAYLLATVRPFLAAVPLAAALASISILSTTVGPLPAVVELALKVAVAAIMLLLTVLLAPSPWLRDLRRSVLRRGAT